MRRTYFLRAVQPLFNFNNSELRVVELEGNPWFVAKDVCEALGLKATPSNGSYQNHYRKLDVSERQETRMATSNGRSTRSVIISESGLYKLIMRSDKPQAKPFQDWVTKVVLPAIRKDGGYIAGEENTDDDDLLMARALQVAQRKIESIQCKSISYQLPRSLGQTHETVRFYQHQITR